MRAGSAALIILCFVLCAGVAKADYAEGYQAYLRGDYTRAVSIWRHAAWVDDDVDAQAQLGDLYSAGKYTSYDPIEAYVWYFMAVINPGHTSKVERVAQTQLEAIFGGIKNLDRLAAQMSSDERRDAEMRIIYILSSRGAEGFVKLGELYAEDVLFGSACSPGDVNSGPQRLGALLSTLQDSQTTSVPPNVSTALDPSVYLYCGPSNISQNGGAGTSVFRKNSSVLQKNSVDAYAYFLIARDRGYKLAGDLATEYRSDLDAINFSRVNLNKPDHDKIVKRIVSKSQEIELSWEPPFDIYPGGHSDESPFGFERTKALSRVKTEIPCSSIQGALAFLGFYKGKADCLFGAGTREATMRYQATLGHATSGVLKPEDVVLLIKTAATKGHSASQERLGEMYFAGVGEPLNYARARHWFEMAADQKDPYALYNLGIIYRDGLGVDVNFDQAAVYFMEAQQTNCPDQRLMDEIRKQLVALGIRKTAQPAAH